MKFLFCLLFLIGVQHAVASSGDQTIHMFQDDSFARLHQQHHSDEYKQSFGVIYLINQKQKHTAVEIIISTDQGQLVIGEQGTSFIGMSEHLGNESMDEATVAAWFFNDPIFDQFITQNLPRENLDHLRLKNYSASDCNNLASAINQVLAIYMHLRRTSNDDGAIAHAQHTLMGLVAEYNNNC